MSEFIKSNKLAGVHWINQPLENLCIRIKLKPKISILALPKYEEYKEKSNKESLSILESNKIEEYTFRWQEKIFSKWEHEKYSDIHNCISDIDLKHHDMLKELNIEPSKVFTYIHEDYYLPISMERSKTCNSFDQITKLTNCFNNFYIDNNNIGNLFKSEEVLDDKELWIAMHIVLDCSEYNELSQIIYKEEHILVSLYHNVTCNYLIVTPDVNDIHYNAHSVEDQVDIEYGLKIDFDKKDTTELVDLLNNLQRKLEKKKMMTFRFIMPLIGRKKYFVTFNIISATKFDGDKLYIEFNIKIPDDLQCTGDLHGRTHLSEYMNSDGNSIWKYGHYIELELECATGIDPLPLKIYLEAISVDWWGRHRTEGYTYLPLALEAGEQRRLLSCSRPEELNSIEANNRRFFVGGCHLIKDLDVLSNPQLHSANFRYTATGFIAVGWRIISQSQSPGTNLPTPEYSTSVLLNGAEAVLQQYKEAKATLAAATHDIETHLKDLEEMVVPISKVPENKLLELKRKTQKAN